MISIAIVVFDLFAGMLLRATGENLSFQLRDSALPIYVVASILVMTNVFRGSSHARLLCVKASVCKSSSVYMLLCFRASLGKNFCVQELFCVKVACVRKFAVC